MATAEGAELVSKGVSRYAETERCWIYSEDIIALLSRSLRFDMLVV